MSTATPHMSVAQFRPRREGPEAMIQDVVAEQIPELFRVGSNSWTAASLPIGAGIPDLVIASYHPKVLALANVELPDAQILAYLRAVRKARLETIAERVGETTKKMGTRITALVDAEAIEVTSDTFTLSPVWRDILPEIVTVEVKVSNWKRAVEQAARNQIFAHRSYVALPEKLASRIKAEPIFSSLGIGLIAVTDKMEANVIKKPKRCQPTVWAYYYRLASVLARSQAN